jgi:hypothetical protein
VVPEDLTEAMAAEAASAADRSCDTCRRPIRGREDDVRVCVVERGECLVLCVECFQRDDRRHGWLEWRIGFAARPMLTDERLAALRGSTR